MKNEITHKELLTFSNLTNLEWQFVELEKKEKGYKEDKKSKDNSNSTILKDLLKPTNFIRKDENLEKKLCSNELCEEEVDIDEEKCPRCGETDFETLWKENFIYGEEIKNGKSTCKKEKGIQEMIRKAGLGMEHLEYWKGRQFLSEWEVESAMNNEYLIVNNWKKLIKTKNFETTNVHL